jgi:hypothetical protein
LPLLANEKVSALAKPGVLCQPDGVSVRQHAEASCPYQFTRLGIGDPPNHFPLLFVLPRLLLLWRMHAFP